MNKFELNLTGDYITDADNRHDELELYEICDKLNEYHSILKDYEGLYLLCHSILYDEITLTQAKQFLLDNFEDFKDIRGF